MQTRILLGVGVFCLFLSTCVVGFLILAKPGTAQVTQKGEAPIVDFVQSGLVDEERTNKSVRYNKLYKGKITEDSHVSVITITDSPVESLPAIPLSESDLVLIGTVRDSGAFLSGDKTTVYSEFSIVTEQVVFEKTPLGIWQGSEILVSFPGGRVRFPSGHIQTYKLEGFDGLVNKGSYIVFLRKTARPNDFDLLMAYEIVDNRVYPINDAQRFSTYKGHTIEEFLKNL